MRDGLIAYADATTRKQADADGLRIEAQGMRLSDGMASMDQLAVQLGESTFEDREPPRPVKVRLSSASLAAQNLRYAEGATIPFELAATFLPRGTLGIKGQFAPLPLSLEAEVTADQLGLAPMQGYVADRLNLTVARADVSALGQLHLALPDAASTSKNAAPHISYAGMLRLTNFATVDKTNATEFLRWKSLHLGKIDFQFPAPKAPMRVALGDVALSDFYARVIINANGRINLQDILVTPGSEAEKSITTPTASSQDAAGATGSKVPPVQTAPVSTATASPPASARPIIRVGRVTLANGAVNFTDNFIKPNYSANISRLTGSISSVASDNPAPADIVLRGAVDGDGTLEITGKVNALSEQLYLDIAANARDIELTRLTPYAAKYAGYAIEKGKLRMNVNYHIENGKLEARNNLFLDQLTFGERIEGPDATKLPVLFAVALLKNSRGEIDIDLPISGSLSDPQFSIGGIIVRLIVNLIAKAVTSPFALIASAFGGGEELDHVVFAPGTATLDSASRSRLDKIVAALADRPALKLDITGRADAASDTEGARQLALKEQVRAQKVRKLLRKSREIDPSEVSVNDEEYAEYLEDAYDAADFPKPRNLIGLQKSLPVEEMEKLMLANIQITDADLRKLAEARANAVLDYLTAESRVARDRVFLIAPKLGSPDKDDKNGLSRVDFSLK